MTIVLLAAALFLAWYLDYRIYRRLHHDERMKHAAILRLREQEVRSWRKLTKRWTGLYAQEVVRNRELHNDLTVERGYSAACDRQLRAIQLQVAGKCLWPTLGDPDVVVRFPKRGA